MSYENLPPLSFLVECFDYDALTGSFRWRARPRHHFASAKDFVTWNAQFAGRDCFRLEKSTGYKRAQVTFDGRRFRLAAGRVAFLLHYGLVPDMVDHVNGDPADNRIENLRPATAHENARNSSGWGNRKFPKGVYQGKDGRIRAAVWVNGQSKKLGTFGSIGAAHAAYREAASVLHGPFFCEGRPTRPTTA